MSKHKIKIVLGSLAIAGLVFAAVAFGAAAFHSANAAAPVAAENSTSGVLQHGPGGRGFEKGEPGSTSEELATALGITTDQLSAAQQTATAAALKQAVDAGLITQAQADEFSANSTAFPFGDRTGDWLTENGIDYQALLADALGISVDELQAAYVKAYNARIDQAVTDGTLTQEQADLMKGQYALFNSESYQSAMKTAFDAAVKQAVSDGVITQAQADLILANQNSMDFPGGRGLDGFGGPEGRHGGHGGMGGVPPANDQMPAEPSATPSTGG
jgi:hypothetical protein